jgi:hypothetical protein
MISAKDIERIRSIARAGSDYDTIKRLLGETEWEIEADEVDLGFLRVFIPDAGGECYRLIIGYRDPDHPPYCLLSFFSFLIQRSISRHSMQRLIRRRRPSRDTSARQL